MRENSKSRDVNGLDGGTQWAQDGHIWKFGAGQGFHLQKLSHNRWPSIENIENMMSYLDSPS